MTRDASIDEGVCVMSIHTYTKDPIGMFTEKDTGNYFEYGVNDCPDFEGNREHYPHIVWVGGEGVCGMRGYRYAKVKKTVAYIMVDEDENGPLLERWFLKSNTEYTTLAAALALNGRTK